MTQQKTSYTRFTADMDSNERRRTIKAVYAPFSYGVELALAWALCARPQVLAAAADCPTLEEQLDEHLTFYGECYCEGSFPDGNIEVIAPDRKDSWPRERVEFFAWAMEAHPFYAREASWEDPGVSYCNEDGHHYFVSNVPVSAFRMFEQGWATAVREVSKNRAKLSHLEP